MTERIREKLQSKLLHFCFTEIFTAFNIKLRHCHSDRNPFLLRFTVAGSCIILKDTFAVQ